MILSKAKSFLGLCFFGTRIHALKQSKNAILAFEPSKQKPMKALVPCLPILHSDFSIQLAA
jgi:hypothetical protein